MKRLPPLLALAAALALLLLLPVPSFYVTLANYAGIAAIVALGLVVVTGFGAMTSFSQATFMGFGAYTTAILTTQYAWSPWLTLPCAIAAAGLAAVLIGLVTLRLSGHFLPLGTLAWSVAFYYVFANLDLFGRNDGISGIPPLDLAGTPLISSASYLPVTATAVAVALLATRNLLGSNHGRAIRALRGGAAAAASFGVNLLAARMLAFAYAGLLAGLAGWLYAHMQRSVNPTPFSLNASIEYLLMAVVGGVASLPGALLGAALVTIVNDQLQNLLPLLFGHAGNYETIVFGALLVLMLQTAPDGLWPLLARPLRQARTRLRPPPNAPVPAPNTPAPNAPALPRRTLPAPGTPVLQADHLTKTFGGLVAVNDVSIHLAAGEIVGLIGPTAPARAPPSTSSPESPPPPPDRSPSSATPSPTPPRNKSPASASPAPSSTSSSSPACPCSRTSPSAPFSEPPPPPPPPFSASTAPRKPASSPKPPANSPASASNPKPPAPPKASPSASNASWKSPEPSPSTPPSSSSTNPPPASATPKNNTSPPSSAASAPTASPSSSSNTTWTSSWASPTASSSSPSAPSSPKAPPPKSAPTPASSKPISAPRRERECASARLERDSASARRERDSASACVTTPLLDVQDLSVAYGGIGAVHGASLHIHTGEIVTVIGPNGAGKTTLLNAIMGAHGGHVAGHLRFRGIDIARIPIEHRVAQGIGLVPESRELFTTLTVEDNLRLGAFRFRRPLFATSRAAATRTTLDEVYTLFPRLQERRRQHAGTLSGGERQMLAMGRALMGRPDLLMLDEPSLGLAPLIVREIFHIIAGLRTRGCAVLLVEQNARAALRVADRAYVLETGRITLEGPATELATDPRVMATYLGAA